MPAYQIRARLIPYRILGYLLYSPESSLEWLESISEDELRITTGDASRALRMKIASFWEALYWLEQQGLILSVTKEQKRGSVIIKLKQPTNIVRS